MNPQTKKELFDDLYDALLAVQRIQEQVGDLEAELNAVKELLIDEFGEIAS